MLVLFCGILVGCNGSNQTKSNSYDERYDTHELRTAKDQAKIRNIENQTERENAEHKILLTATQNNIRLVGDVDILKINYNALDSLIKKLAPDSIKEGPILVASFVSLDNLNESSTFGRVISEQVASRFKQKGYTTIEMKLRTTVFIKEGSGEFLLSRELSKIGNKHSAQAVIVGSYTAASDRVYLTIRVVNVEDSEILASYDYNIPMSRDVFKMLLKNKKGADWL